MLREALSFCKTIGLCDILITCDRDNTASSSMIENCGGILECEFYRDVFKTDVLKYKILLA